MSGMAPLSAKEYLRLGCALLSEKSEWNRGRIFPPLGEAAADEEISIGDYVLTGGELPALVLTDTIARMVPGVLPEDLCFEDESHFGGLLEYPQYTRPAVWHDREVPPVLLTGHHKNIAEWRNAQSIEETKNKRPDLYASYLDKK